MQIHMETVAGYIKKTLPQFFECPASGLTVSEIGDGNINYVFRIEDKCGRSVIVKHAEPTVRSSMRYVGVERSMIEAEALRLQHSLCPEHVPEVYFYDEETNSIVMEDMREYANLRYALVEHRVFENLARHLADFCAKTLIMTSGLVLPPEEKKSLVGRYINIALCEISERLVFTEPYFPTKNNCFCRAILS